MKLENLLIMDDLSIKISDFGFAENRNIETLTQMRGTRTYMAPEMKLMKEYNGKSVDIFSVGVILFILVHGIYPFSEAKKDESFYQKILDGELDKYW